MPYAFLRAVLPQNFTRISLAFKVFSSSISLIGSPQTFSTLGSDSRVSPSGIASGKRLRFIFAAKSSNLSREIASLDFSCCNNLSTIVITKSHAPFSLAIWRKGMDSRYPKFDKSNPFRQLEGFFNILFVIIE